MLIEASDPRTVSVMSLLQHLNTQELKDLLNEDDRFEIIIKDSQCVSKLVLPHQVLFTYRLTEGEAAGVGKRCASCQQQILGRVQSNL